MPALNRRRDPAATYAQTSSTKEVERLNSVGCRSPRKLPSATARSDNWIRCSICTARQHFGCPASDLSLLLLSLLLLCLLVRSVAAVGTTGSGTHDAHGMATDEHRRHDTLDRECRRNIASEFSCHRDAQNDQEPTSRR
jgi:hypothetical protein